MCRAYYAENNVPVFTVRMFQCSQYECSSVHSTNVPVFTLRMFQCSHYECSSVHSTNVPVFTLRMFQCSQYECSSVYITNVPVFTVRMFQCSQYECLLGVLLLLNNSGIIIYHFVPMLFHAFSLDHFQAFKELIETVDSHSLYHCSKLSVLPRHVLSTSFVMNFGPSDLLSFSD